MQTAGKNRLQKKKKSNKIAWGKRGKQQNQYQMQETYGEQGTKQLGKKCEKQQKQYQIQEEHGIGLEYVGSIGTKYKIAGEKCRKQQ